MQTYTAPFLLIRSDGWTAEFNDLAALARAVREARLEITARHVWFEVSGGLRDNPWIVRDAFGEPVTSLSAPCRRYVSQHDEQASHAAALGLPIPHTGKQSSYGRHFRRFRFFGANRARAAAEADAAENQFPKGKINWLPTNRDDLVRGDASHRSWKRHRRTQWQEK